MKEVYAPYQLATRLMDNLFDLYACVVLSSGADLDDETLEQEANKQATRYAQQKFVELCDEFEKNIPGLTWRWEIDDSPLDK